MKEINKPVELVNALKNISALNLSSIIIPEFSKIIPKPTAADVAEQEAKWTAQGKPFKKGDAIKALEVAPTEAMEQRATQAPEDYPESKSSTGWASMSQGKKIGIVAGLVAFVGLVIGLIVKSKKKR